MKTIFHDKESGAKLEMEGTFANSKAQLVDDEGNVIIESEGSYLEILEMINQLSGEENEQAKEESKQLCEDIAKDEENLTNDDFRGVTVKVLEDIEDEYGDVIDKGTITRDITILFGEDLFIEGVFVRPNDFKKLEILTDNEKHIQSGELFVVNNDEMEYYLGFEKGEIVKFLHHREVGLPLTFKNSKGVEQAVELEDVTLLENQEGNNRRFDFCINSNILLTEDTKLEETKVNLSEFSVWIEDDGSLIIHTDCSDGVPYVMSRKSGEGAFIGLSGLKLRTKEDAVSFEVGEVVEVKEGRSMNGAVGFAVIEKINEDEVTLKGFNEQLTFSNKWQNRVENIKKI